jgi:hypothetical protein
MPNIGIIIRDQDGLRHAIGLSKLTSALLFGALSDADMASGVVPPDDNSHWIALKQFCSE